MSGKLTTGALVAVGLLLVALGVQKWFDSRQAAKTVDAFMDAVRQGDRDAALALLDPNQRRVAEKTRQTAKWTPDPNLDYRIHHIDISGNEASAPKLTLLPAPEFKLPSAETVAPAPTVKLPPGAMEMDPSPIMSAPAPNVVTEPRVTLPVALN